MKLKHLQSALSSIPTKQFPNPKITLEQYATSPELASHVVQCALSKGDIGRQQKIIINNNDHGGDEEIEYQSTSVLDLGCGTGMLSIGCAIVGTKFIYCVDCDEEAIGIVKENVYEMGLEDPDDDVDSDDNESDGGACVFEFVLAQVKHTTSSTSIGNGGGRGRGKGGRGRGGRSSKGRRPSLSPNLVTQTSNSDPKSLGNNDDGVPLPTNFVDTVITNPPFGTKHNAGIDVSFLRTAIRLATRAVYSFHKSSTSAYLIKTIQSWGYDAEVVAQMKFDIPKMYKFHKKDEVDVEVDLIRVNILASASSG